jgi:hypothetical protein
MKVEETQMVQNQNKSRVLFYFIFHKSCAEAVIDGNKTTNQNQPKNIFFLSGNSLFLYFFS